MVNEILEKYMDGILKWNEAVNLTAITDREEFKIKHLEDSLMVVDFPEYIQAKKIIDIGTGAGFPGIPLAVNSPDKEFVLMDSLLKRLKIIDELAGELGISNVVTCHGRAEDLAQRKEHREVYDLSVSRAVSNLTTLSEYALPFIKVGGYFLAYKGPEAIEEVSAAKKAISVLGGEIIDIRETKMEKYGISHNVVVIKKVKPTPTKYPRKAGTPLKEPIR